MPETAVRHLRIFDLALTLSGPAAVLSPIAFAYRRFRTDAPAPGSVVLSLADDPEGRIEVDGRPLPLVPGLDPTAQVYRWLLDTVMDRVGSHALLHAAALVEPSGGGLLLSAPSGHGKSSLALELVSRGYGFLGDDYAPLDLERGLVHPYPRAVGLTADASRRLVAPEAALGPLLMGKRLADVGAWFGEERLVGRPVPVRHVALLSGSVAGSPAPATTGIRLAGPTAGADETDAAFRATEGVEILERRAVSGITHWRLRVDHARHPTRDLSRVLESGRVLFVEKTWDERPDFTAEPALAPIPRREAAEFLGRELLNRRGGGRLLASHGGSTVTLFVALAGSLRAADCYRLQVGDRSRTATLLEELAVAGARLP
jgi:hypothetical protein